MWVWQVGSVYVGVASRVCIGTVEGYEGAMEQSVRMSDILLCFFIR